MAAASAAQLTANGALKMATTSQAYLEGDKVKETKSLIAELCRHFYNQGWVSGTGGSITIKVHDESVPKSEQLIVMSPSGEKNPFTILPNFLIFGFCLFEFFVDGFFVRGAKGKDGGRGYVYYGIRWVYFICAGG